MSSYIALYRKWRPAVFEDVIGQEHITDVLRGEISRGSVSHAYLFCGSRGTGKTTCAKILAKAVSCENPIGGDPCGVCENCKRANGSFDISEIDAASNNGVDNIRELREEVLYPPSELKRRVYIIDEVHMLSTGAFNALLKTLEEPPEHAMFILATTELNKIPATILSRCKRFDFHRITPDNIAKRLGYICGKENIPMTEDAIKLISRLAGGAMRDALSMLELFVGKTEEITEEACAAALGVVGRGPVMKLVSAIADNDCTGALSVIAEAYNGSKDMGVLLSECADTMRDILMMKYTKTPGQFVEGSEDVLAQLSECAKKFTRERLIYSTEIIDEAQSRMARTSFSRRAILETCVIRLCDVRLWTLPEALNTRISELEDRISSGDFVVTSTPTVKATEVIRDKQRNDSTDALGLAIDNEHTDAPPEDYGYVDMPPFDTEPVRATPESKKITPPATSLIPDIPDLPSKGEVPVSEAAQQSPKKSSPATVSDSSEVSEPLSAMPEILEEIRAKDKICGSLLAGTKGYRQGDRRVVITVSGFAYNMLKNDEKKMSLVIASAKKMLGEVEVRVAPEGKKVEDEWEL